jgi:hypothetical protein
LVAGKRRREIAASLGAIVRDLTEALAELFVSKLKITGHHAEVCELLADETSTIHDSLVDIGHA